jgi:hypothetical protein
MTSSLAFSAGLSVDTGSISYAATQATRKLFYETYAAFVSAFRAATEALRRGERDAPFPTGSFPPALPFVSV